MVHVDVDKNEPIDRALKKFKSKVRKDGIMDEIRKREFYEKPSDRRRRRRELAKRRQRREEEEEV